MLYFYSILSVFHSSHKFPTFLGFGLTFYIPILVFRCLRFLTSYVFTCVFLWFRNFVSFSFFLRRIWRSPGMHFCLSIRYGLAWNSPISQTHFTKFVLYLPCLLTLVSFSRVFGVLLTRSFYWKDYYAYRFTRRCTVGLVNPTICLVNCSGFWRISVVHHVGGWQEGMSVRPSDIRKGNLRFVLVVSSHIFRALFALLSCQLSKIHLLGHLQHLVYKILRSEVNQQPLSFCGSSDL